MRTIVINNPGPQGPAGPQGPSGSTPPFSNVSESVWATTSSIQISGSFLVSGSSTFTNIGPAIFSGSVDITSNLIITGSTTSTSGFTGSLLGTSSLAINAQTASFASTALGLYLNVLTYGADPTGVADSTTAIQNAINASTSSFEFISGSILTQGNFARIHQTPTIFFPKGKYLINNTLIVAPGQELLGDSGATLIAGTVGMVMLKSLDPTIDQLKALYGTYGARNVKINNLVFDGDSKASIGLLLQSLAAGSVISNCRLYLINSSSLSPSATATTTAGSDTITITSPAGLQSNMLITLEGEDYPFAINTINTGSGVTTLSRSPQNTGAGVVVRQIPTAIALAGSQQTYIENVDATRNGSGFYAVEFQPVQNDIGTTDITFVNNKFLQNTYANFLENVGGLRFLGNTFHKTTRDRNLTLKSTRGVSFLSSYIESADYATVGENGLRQVPMVDIQTSTGITFRDTHFPQDANSAGFRYVFNNKSDNTIIDGITTSVGPTAENPRFVDLGMRFTSVNVGTAGSASLNLTNVTIDLQQGDYVYVNFASIYTDGNYQILSLDRTAKTALINVAYAGSTTGTDDTSQYVISSVANGGANKLDLTLNAVPNALREGLYARFNFDSVYASGYYKVHDITGSVVTITSSLSYTSTATGLATPPTYSFTSPQKSSGDSTTFTFPSSQYPYDVSVKDVVYLITTASQYNGEAVGSTKLDIISVTSVNSLTAIRVNSVPNSINPDTVVYVNFSAGGTSGFYEVQGTSGIANGYIYLNLPYVGGMAVNYITKPYYTEVLDVDPINYTMTFDVEYSSSAASGYMRPAEFAFIQQHKTIGSTTVKNIAGQTSIRNLNKFVVDQFYAQNPDRAIIEQEYEGQNNIKRPNTFWTNDSTTTPISLQRFGEEYARVAITDNSISWGSGSIVPYVSLSFANNQLQLQGTSSWATNALTASTATTVEVNDVPGNNATNYLGFYLSNTGYRPTRVASTKFVVNPATGSMGINKSTITTGYSLDVNGSVLISGSALITGSLNVTGSTILNNGQTTIRGAGATSATTTFLVQNSTPTTLFQIQDHGSSSFNGNLTITGSLMVRDILQLAVRTTTPTAVEGMIIASGSVGASRLFYYNGTTWNALF